MRELVIGLVSDTHGRFDEALNLLFGRCDRILHAGDIGHGDVLERLAILAPVEAVRGNIDVDWTVPERRRLTLGGVEVLLLHALTASDARFPGMVVHGHSHRPGVEISGETLLVNPGSAGPARFSLPRSAGLCRMSAEAVRIDLVEIDSTRFEPLCEPVVWKLRSPRGGGRTPPAS